MSRTRPGLNISMRRDLTEFSKEDQLEDGNVGIYIMEHSFKKSSPTTALSPIEQIDHKVA